MPESKKHYNKGRRSLDKKIWLMYLFAFVFPPVGIVLAVYMLFHLKGPRSISLKKQAWIALFVSLFVLCLFSYVIYEKANYFLTPVEELYARHGSCSVIGFYCSLSNLSDDAVSLELTNRYDFPLGYVNVQVGEEYCEPTNLSLGVMNPQTFSCPNQMEEGGEQILQFSVSYARNGTEYNASRTSIGQLFLFQK
jgi:hypothetical protein